MSKLRDNEKDLEVYFSFVETEPNPGQIIIYVDKNTWNDFGFKIQCDFIANLQSSDKVIHGSLLLGFIPEDNIKSDIKVFEQDYSSLKNALISLNVLEDQKISSKAMPNFFTLLPNIQEYRALVSKLGIEQANYFLSLLNDLVIHKEKDDSQIWFEEAIKSNVFSLAFMRNSEPFFAFHNASSVLAGEGQENFEAISHELDLSFKLDGFTNKHKIMFRFGGNSSSLIPKRINILIGKNGLGKSQALNHFCRSALQYRDAKDNLQDVQRSTQRPMINRLLAIGTPGETSNTFPAERIKTQKLYYRRLNLTRNSNGRDSKRIGETLLKLARSDEEIGGKDRWSLFYEALTKVMTIGKLSVALKKDNRYGKEYINLSALRNQSGEQNVLELWSNIEPNAEPRICIDDKFYPLSSGQLTFFKFALLCCVHIDNGSIVLMDEPETHLHPNLIADFVELLDYILEHTGSQAIIATHSAYFVKEVPRAQVYVFIDDGDGGISIGSPRLRTFGSDVDSISKFVFGEDSESRLTDKLFNRVKERTFEEIDKELSGEISLAALMDIRRRMEE